VKLPILISITVFIILVNSVSFAVDFSYGIKGGILYSSFNGSHSGLADLENFDRNVIIGPSIGGFIRLGIEEILFIQPELLFTLKGESYWNEATNEKRRVDLYYIEIPVFFAAAYPLPTSVHIAPRVFFGPYLGLHLLSGGDTKDLGIDVNPLDLGLILGIGIDVENMLFEIQYGFGFTPISEDLTFLIKSVMIGFKL